MNKMTRSLVILFLFVAASAVCGAVPPMTVTVSGPGGKVAFKGSTNTGGTFATGSLGAGNYVVQFTSSSAAVKGNTYAVVVSAGKKKVAADSVAGEKFAAGGVAMKIDVAAGLNVTGQVAGASKTMLDKSGKKMVWIPKKLGSNIPAHWAAADSAEAKEAGTQGTMSTSELQRRQSQGISGASLGSGN